MWKQFYSEIFISTSHPSPSGFDLQFLFEQTPKIGHNVLSLGSRVSDPVDKQLHLMLLQMIVSTKPPNLADNSLGVSLLEFLPDCVFGKSDSAMYPTYVTLQLDPEIQTDWFASLSESPPLTYFAAIECNSTSH